MKGEILVDKTSNRGQHAEHIGGMSLEKLCCLKNASIGMNNVDRGYWQPTRTERL